MKVVKSVQFPLKTLLEELQNSEPRYITLEGVLVNVYELAANLIESLLWQADEAESERRELTKIVDELLPGLCRLADIAEAASLCFGESLYEPETVPDDSDADNYPRASVISAVVKHEQV